MSTWLVQHWFQLLQTIGIVGSLLFTAASLRNARRVQQISNLFQLTQYHRQLYGELFDRPELRRIFREDVNLEEEPLTQDERLFITLALLHFNLALEATAKKAIIPIEGLEKDGAKFFSLPIPKAVWGELEEVQNRRLAKVINEMLASTKKRETQGLNA